MARRKPKPDPTRTEVLDCIIENCPNCGSHMWVDYENTRVIVMLPEVVKLRLRVRRCPNKDCERYHKPYRPECEGGWALPKHEFGLDVIAAIGHRRYRHHETVSEIHAYLREQDVAISERSVTNQLDRYDELVTLSLQSSERLQALLKQQGRVILAVDGLQPDMGHEVLWVVRDCLSGEVLCARALLSSSADDLSKLLAEVQEMLPVEVEAVVSDGQRSLRNAIAQTFPDVPHGLCHFHYLREAARPLYEADRHAKKELKKQVRGIRPLERKASKRSDEMGGIIQDYCQAVRSAITDDGRAPLEAAGLRLRQRLTAIRDSLLRLRSKGGYPPNSSDLKSSSNVD
jgi:hypothetical protein